MKLIEIRHGVTGFFLYDGEETLIHKDKIEIGKVVLPVEKNEVFHCVNEVLYKESFNENNCRASLTFRFDGKTFVEEKYRYEIATYFSRQQYCSVDSKNGKIKLSFVENDKETLSEFESGDDDYFVLHYAISQNVLILYSYCDNSLLFYTKTGERLWEYQVEEGLEIYEDAVVVVDDTVVITCTENNKIVSVEGYKLLTGEKIWDVEDLENCDYDYVIGPDQMLYALSSYLCKDHSNELRLTKLNPFTGEIETAVLKEGDYWSEIWPRNTTIYDNKLFYVNETDSQGCSFGVVDLDTKELIEDFPMESQGNQIEKPIVTDDKIYVRVRDVNELRIYENEYK